MPITFDAAGVPSAGPATLDLSEAEYASWDIWPGPHDFSPEGDKIVYCRLSDRRVVIYDRTSKIKDVLTTSDCGFDIGWSVRDEILFSKSGARYGWGFARIDINGSNETDLVMPKGNYSAGSVYWSPDGNYIVYLYSKTTTLCCDSFDFSSYRIDRNGRGKTAVDGRLGHNGPRGWR